MTRLLALAGVTGWIGATLLLSEMRWFRRPSLAERLRPHAPGGLGPGARAGMFSVRSFRDIVGPLAQAAGGGLARVFGVSEELATRLERVHSPLSVQEFRTRQLGWSLAAVGAAVLTTLALRPPPALGLLALLGAPLLAFLLHEQAIQAASTRRQRRIFLELPVITEQIGMLLSAGFSLGAALNRLSKRSSGACAEDLQIVCGRIRQGLSEIEALREWASLAQVGALDRLIGVLALNRTAGDLGKLITEEARSIRREAHRELLETIERRSQQVWIPVTVATLIPGVLFMVVPFVEAMRLFAGS